MLFNGRWAVLGTLDQLIDSFKKWSLFSSVSRTCKPGVSNYLVVLLLISFKAILLTTWPIQIKQIYNCFYAASGRSFNSIIIFASLVGISFLRKRNESVGSWSLPCSNKPLIEIAAGVYLKWHIFQFIRGMPNDSLIC